MKISTGILWIVAAALVVLAVVRPHGLPDPYAPGAATGTIEDRRQHHFRNWSYARTQELAASLLEEARRATSDRTRALALARLATLQRERGFQAQAEAAAREALRLAGSDPEVRRVVSQPLDVREILQ